MVGVDVTDWADSYPREAAAVPPPIAFAELWPWAVFAAALVGLIGLVSVANGEFIHEFLHDGRHLLAFPCN